jgi:hypothetical protein
MASASFCDESGSIYRAENGILTLDVQDQIRLEAIE